MGNGTGAFTDTDTPTHRTNSGEVVLFINQQKPMWHLYILIHYVIMFHLQQWPSPPSP
jgi:hypothetical protein